MNLQGKGLLGARPIITGLNPEGYKKVIRGIENEIQSD